LTGLSLSFSSRNVKLGTSLLRPSTTPMWYQPVNTSVTLNAVARSTWRHPVPASESAMARTPSSCFIKTRGNSSLETFLEDPCQRLLPRDLAAAEGVEIGRLDGQHELGRIRPVEGIGLRPVDAADGDRQVFIRSHGKHAGGAEDRIDQCLAHERRVFAARIADRRAGPPDRRL